MTRRVGRASATAGQGGAALVYVLSILAILGLLTAGALRQIGFDRRLVLREEARTQAALLAESGADYALARLGGLRAARPGLTLDDAEGRVDGEAFAYKVSLGPWGLGCRIRSSGVASYPAWTLERELSAEAGHRLDLSEWPALTLMEHGSHPVLAGDAKVDGNILSWQGIVGTDTDPKLRYRGAPFPKGKTLDSTAAQWRHLPFDFAYLREWYALADQALAGNWPPAWDRDPGASRDSVELRDSIFAEGRTIAARVLSIASGARLSRSLLLASRIRISGGARLHDCLVTAAGRLDVEGDAEIEGGQFLAGDTLRLECSRSMKAFPVFAVRGRIRASGKDTAYACLLHARRLSGQAVLLSASLDRPRWEASNAMTLDPGCEWEGLAYAQGFATLAGRLRGAIIATNLMVEAGGTLYLGRVRDAEIVSPGAGQVRAELPLIVPGLALATLRKRMP